MAKHMAAMKFHSHLHNGQPHVADMAMTVQWRNQLAFRDITTPKNYLVTKNTESNYHTKWIGHNV